MAVSMRMPIVPRCAMPAATAPTMAAAGIVSSHPEAMRPAVDHWTSAPLRPRPEPRTEPEATCVVDRAKPRCDEARMAAAVEVSADRP